MFGRIPGHRIARRATAAAAVGATILVAGGFIPSPPKWWGPAVLEAGCGRTSSWAIREPPKILTA